jgi:hypothetical protein
MKWSTLLSKVVFAGQPQPPPPPPPPASPLSQQGDHSDSATPRLSSASTSGSGPGDDGGSSAAASDAAAGYSPSSAASRWVPRRLRNFAALNESVDAYARSCRGRLPTEQWPIGFGFSGSARSIGGCLFPPFVSLSGDLVGRCGI